MSKNIGIMQGRLLPKYKNKYQAHPVGYWENEFPIASKLDLNLIEFIFDHHKSELNPLLNKEGLKKIQEVEKLNNIKVKSICADYFMEAPLHSNNKSVVDKSLNTLDKLINNASLIKIKDIVIPCVDHSSLRNESDIKNFVNNIKSLINEAEKKDINICLETDLSPTKFAKLLEDVGSNNIKVNYDTGNSAALGYDPVEEFNAYGEKITDLHIKDRLYGGESVPLGSGNVNFLKIFDLLFKYDYKGIIIFQAFRDDEGIEIFKKQYKWFKDKIDKFYI